MLAYATHTGSRKNRAAVAEFGWRWFMTPTNNGDGYKPYALDNGAWGAFRNGIPFDETAFLKLVTRFWEGADFIVAPDIVEGGLASLDLSLSWLERLPPVLRLIPVQDGGVTASERTVSMAQVSLDIARQFIYLMPLDDRTLSLE